MVESSELFTKKNSKYLLVYARWALSNSLFPGLPAPRLPDDLPEGNFGLFVTLTRKDKIRGSMGAISSEQPLLESLAAFTQQAAVDPNYPAVELTELPAIVIEIMIITEAETICASTPVHLLSALTPKVHGLVLENKNHYAYLLPKMWETFSERHSFIEAIIKKGGWDHSLWPIGLMATKFKTVHFKESYTKPVRA